MIQNDLIQIDITFDLMLRFSGWYGVDVLAQSRNERSIDRLKANLCADRPKPGMNSKTIGHLADLYFACCKSLESVVFEDDSKRKISIFIICRESIPQDSTSGQYQFVIKLIFSLV
jgi:hypothetical protein